MSKQNLPIDIPETITHYSGTRTEQNLWIAFIGESMARNRYDYYASVAKKAGYEELADLLRHTAENEKEHAKIWFKKLSQLGEVDENLIQAIENEHLEWTEMYPQMAIDAREDGYDDIAMLFDGAAKIEKHHEERFKEYLSRLKAGTVFYNGQPIMWECRNCGHIMFGTEPPATCPVCNHPMAYFQKAEQ